jgi:hypothetical protein
MTCALLAAALWAALYPPQPLWSIGEGPGVTRFALGPGGYADYKNDANFVVGRSDPDMDWPYVQPGPDDAWAGSRAHTFRVFFGVASTDPSAHCSLKFSLRDTHRSSPPTIVVSLNGREIAGKKLPPGAGDASVFGTPAAGRKYEFEIPFSGKLLHKGVNQLAIESRAGSWLLYDSASLETSGGVALGQAPETAAAFDPPDDMLLDKGSPHDFQKIGVHVVHFGPPALASVSADGEPKATFRVDAGTTDAAVPIPAVTKPTHVRLACEVAGRTIAEEEMTVKPVRHWVIYIIPHSHVDIGYTMLQPDVEKRQIANTEQALRLIETKTGFKWNSEALWGVDAFIQKADATKREELFAAVAAGDFGLQALFGNELTGLCRPEELIRLTDRAVQIRRERHVDIDTAMISDVPGYTWGLVPALLQSGIKYFSVGPNPGDRIGGTLLNWGDKPFWWVGPNRDDRVLCWVAGLGYAAFHGRSLAQAGEPWLTGYLRRLEAAGYPYDMVQLRYTTGDNGPPDPALIDTVRRWNAKHTYPQLVFATAGKMFHDFEKAYGSKIPSLRGDMTPYWEDGAASSAWETAENRATAEKLVQAEALWAMQRPGRFPVDDFDSAWRNVILYDEHTWGAYNSISEPDSPFVKGQWAIKKGYADNAASEAQVLLHGAAQRYAGESNVSIVNTNSWPAGGLAEIDCAEGDRVQDGRKSVPSQRLANGRLAFLAEGVPAFGARLYRVAPGRAPEFRGVSVSGTTLSGPDLTVKVDPRTGAITSLRSESLGRELVSSSVGANSFLYLPGGDLKNLQGNGPAKVTVKERGPLVASLLIESEAPGCRKLTREVRLVYGRDCVEVIDTVDKLPVRDKEGVHFAFGFNVPNATTRIEIAWGMIRPELDQLPGSCKNSIAAQRWVDVSNGRYGVTIASPDSPLWEVGAITGNLPGSRPDPAAWLQHIKSSSTLYAWVMNNHWHTNYKADQQGPTTFRYMIRPHGAFRSDEAVRFGVECGQPLLALSAQTAKRLAVPLVQLGPGPIVVTSLKPSRDRRATMIRLFNPSDRPAHTTLTWRDRVRLWNSNAGEEMRSVARPEVSLPPWGVVTLRADIEPLSR